MKWVMGTGTVVSTDNCCEVGDGDRYCCENRLNCCEVGDGDRYCCENRLNCCEVWEVGNNNNNNKVHPRTGPERE